MCIDSDLRREVLSCGDELSWKHGDLDNKELHKFPLRTSSWGDSMKKVRVSWDGCTRIGSM
jgi:hypothetical protein